MFQKSQVDNIYPSVSNYSQESMSRLADYQPTIGSLTSAYRAGKATTFGMGDYLIAGAKILGDVALSPAKILYDHLTHQDSHIFSNVSPDLKASAVQNEIGSLTTGNHPIVDFGASAVPFVVSSLLTGGGAAVAEGGAEAAGSIAADTIAKTAAENSFTPMSMLTSDFAKEVGVNQAIAPQGALELDKNGNVKIDPTTEIVGAALGLGIPLVSRGIGKVWRSKNRTRLAEVPETPPQSANDEQMAQTSQVSENVTPFNTQATSDIVEKSTDGVVQPATSDQIQSIQENYSNDILKEATTSDVEIPNTEAIGKDMFADPAQLRNKNHLFLAANAVQDMKDNGVKIAGQTTDIDDPQLINRVNDSIKYYEATKSPRGAQKTALTKTITENGIGKWQDIVNKSRKMPLRSTGALKNNTNEFFYHFTPDDFSNADIQSLKSAPDSDLTAKSLLALHQMSATHNFDANLATLKSIRNNLKLYKNGILDLRKNWSKMDSQKVNDFVDESFTKYADYFTDPHSSGFIKLSKNYSKANKLIQCLIRAI